MSIAEMIKAKELVQQKATEKVIFTGVDEQPIEEDGTRNYIPSQKELDDHIVAEQAKEDSPDIENQQHGNKCGGCEHFIRETPNPRSQMARCKWHGMMVTQFQTSCEAYKLSNKPESAWKPEGD